VASRTAVILSGTSLGPVSIDGSATSRDAPGRARRAERPSMRRCKSAPSTDRRATRNASPGRLSPSSRNVRGQCPR